MESIFFIIKTKENKKKKECEQISNFRRNSSVFFHSLKLSERAWRFKIRGYPIEENACFFEILRF